MHIVGKFVRSAQLEAVTKYLEFVLRQRAKLEVGVLQVQICQLHLVDDLFAHLRTDRYPDHVSFFLDFLVLLELSRAESDIVERDEDKLAHEPAPNLLLALALTRPCVGLVLALFE